MTTFKQYDFLNRLTLIYGSNSTSGLLNSHGYAYNNANQRIAATNADNSAWNYGYDSLGQVTSGKKYWSDGSVVAGEQFGYLFDDIGNRQTTAAGGDQWGANLRYANYSVNDLNQYTSRTVPGAVDNGSWLPECTNAFGYDGWNLQTTLNPAFAVEKTFMWGNDLSGSIQGAGGVGGLLKVYSSGTNYFASCDGNGNVSGLSSAIDGRICAQYEYGPFGEVIRATGPMAKLNPFRFSTKYEDDESDLFYYGYRFYNASMGRWLSPDNATEPNLRSLYGMVHNDPIDKVDVLGQDDWQGPPAPIPPVDPTWPNDGYNCAGCAFRVCQYMSKPDTLARLAKCSASDKSSRCACGLRKCHYYDITSWQITDPKGNVTTQKADDFRIDCGDEDGGQCTSKNGPNPPIGGGDINSHPAGLSNPIPPGYTVKAIYTDKYYCCKP